MSGVYRDLLSKGLIYGVGSSLNGLVGLLLIPFLMQHLGAAQYGRYALADMVINILIALATLGVNVSLITQYFALRQEDRNGLFRGCVALVAAFSVTLLSSLTGIVLLLRALGIEVVPMALWYYVAVITPLEALWMMFATLYRAEGHARRFVALSFGQITISFGLTVVLILKTHLEEQAILVSRAVADICVLASAIACQRGLWGKPNWPATIAALKVGLPTVPATFSGMWLMMAPRVLLGVFSGDFELGVYSMAARLGGVINLALTQPFNVLWLPAAFRIKERSDAPKIFSRIVTYYILVAASLVSMIVILAPWVSSWLATDRFPLPPELVGIIAAGLACLGLATAINLGPYFERRTAAAVPAYVTAGILSLLSGSVLIKLYGAYGAAIQLILGYLVLVGLLYKISRPLYRVDYDLRRIGLSIGISISACAGGVLLIQTGFGLTAGIAFYVLLHAIAIASTRFFLKDEIVALHTLGQILLKPRATK